MSLWILLSSCRPVPIFQPMPRQFSTEVSCADFAQPYEQRIESIFIEPLIRTLSPEAGPSKLMDFVAVGLDDGSIYFN